ncbi:DUF1622 domain-containing protein [Candidatus Dependentiae bacterium]
MMQFFDFIYYISFLISIVGVVVISWGALVVVFNFLYGEFLYIFKNGPKVDKNGLRVNLGLFILLGLEFMVAGDIIHTVLSPSKDALITLGSIVAIRTVISYFLHKEIQGAKEN